MNSTINFYPFIQTVSTRTKIIVKNHDIFNHACLNVNEPITNIESVTITELLKNEYIKQLASNGILKHVHIIDDSISSSIIYQLLESKIDEYKDYIRLSSVDYSTSQEIFTQLKVMFCAKKNKAYDLDVQNENSSIHFLKILEKDYLDKLIELDVYDELRLLQEVKVVSNMKNLYIEESYYQELSYLEKVFLGYPNNELPLICFDQDTSENNYRCYKVYGNTTEITNVVNIITEEKRKYGDISLIYTSNKTLSLIKSLFEARRISHYFADINVYGSEISELFLSLCHFVNQDYELEALEPFKMHCPKLKKGLELLQELNFTYGLDQYKRFVKEMSNHRQEYIDFYLNEMEFHLSTSKDKLIEDKDLDFQNTIDFVTSLICLASLHSYQGFYKQALDIIENFFVKSKTNTLILSTLKDDIEFYGYFNNSTKMEMMTNFMLDRIKSLKYSEASNEGVIQVIKFNDYRVLTRHKNYIIGLSFDEFENKVQDSPILRDEDKLTYYDVNAGYIPLAKDGGSKKRNAFRKMLLTKNNASFDLSYSFFDSVEKRETSASLIYNKLKEEHHLIECYINRYDDLIDDNYRFDSFAVTLDGSEKNLFNVLTPIETTEDGHQVFTYSMSASSFTNLCHCYYEFLYNNQHFKQYCSYKKNTWLNPIVKGTFCHKLLEIYINKMLIDKTVTSECLDSKVFEELFTSLCLNYRKVYPVINESIFKKESTKYKELLKNYLYSLYEDLRSSHYVIKNIEQKEKNIIVSSLNEDGKPFDKTKDKIEYRLSMTGQYDRYDELTTSDGSKLYRIIDYKTNANGKTDSKQYLVYPKMSAFKDASKIDFIYQYILYNSKQEIVDDAKIKSEMHLLDDTLNDIIHSTIHFKERCDGCFLKNKCIHFLAK